MLHHLFHFQFHRFRSFQPKSISKLELNYLFRDNTFNSLIDAITNYSFFSSHNFCFVESVAIFTTVWISNIEYNEIIEKTFLLLFNKATSPWLIIIKMLVKMFILITKLSSRNHLSICVWIYKAFERERRKKWMKKKRVQ